MQDKEPYWFSRSKVKVTNSNLSKSLYIAYRAHFQLDLEQTSFSYFIWQHKKAYRFQRSRSQIGYDQKPCIQPRGHIHNQIFTLLHSVVTNGKTKSPFDFLGQRSRSLIGNCQNICIQPRGHIFNWFLTKLHSVITYDKTRGLRISNVKGQGHRLDMIKNLVYKLEGTFIIKSWPHFIQLLQMARQRALLIF